MAALDDVNWRLWAIAFLLFGVADVGVTIFALFGHAAETNPFYPTVLEQFSFLEDFGIFSQITTALSVWKVAVIGLFFVLYLAVPDEFRDGVPLGLIFLGGAVLFWNITAVTA